MVRAKITLSLKDVYFQYFGNWDDKKMENRKVLCGGGVTEKSTDATLR
jgi:hypothetical protein